MPAILFLITPDAPHNDNHRRLPEMFRARDWRVDIARHDALAMHNAVTFADALDLGDYDLVWPIGFGPQSGYLDRASMLARVDNLATPIAAMTFLHAKTAWLEHGPETHVSSDPERLASIVSADNGPWVLKPNAASLGRDVHRVSTPERVREVATGGPRVWLLQRYVDAIQAGEARTMVARGELLGSYLRLPGADGRTNLATGATATVGEPDPRAASAIEAVHRRLLQAGVGLAAIDTAGEYVIEVNVANPGGLSTLESLYGFDLGPRLVAAFTP